MAKSILVIEHGSTRVTLEIKAGRGDKPIDERMLERTKTDVCVKSGCPPHQTAESDALRPHIDRHGMIGDPNRQSYSLVAVLWRGRENRWQFDFRRFIG